jgi:DNA-binding response OmpR family regulator
MEPLRTCSPRRVLVVEDDEAVRRGLVDALTYAGFEVLQESDGTAGLETALATDLDVVLLDIILPEMDGFTVLARLRQARPRLPVILVTARGAERDRVDGLRGGADDYVVKPFSALELLARVEAVLRRSAERPTSVSAIRHEGRTVRLERREVELPDGRRRHLSEKEAEILRYLAGSRGRAVGRDELLRALWGLDPRGLETRTIDMHITRLREKLGDRDGSDRLVLTVRTRGYMLADAAEVT